MLFLKTADVMMLVMLLACAFNAWSSLGADESAYQQLIGCAFNNQGQISHFWRYGYNSKDVMHIDLVKETMVPSGEAGQFLADERKSLGYVKQKEKRLMKVCSAVQTVFLLSNSSLSRAVKPTVFVRILGEEGQKFLMCQVHGFYPNVIRVQWIHQGKPIYYGTSTTGILPHKDGTFQMISYLSLSNTTVQDIACQIEHISIEGKMRATLEEKSMNILLSVISGAAFLTGFVLPVGATMLYLRIKRKTKPSEDAINRPSEESDTPPSVSLMQLAEEL